MPSPLLQLRIPQDLADWLEAKHPSRGEVAAYVRQLLTAEQMKEAVAPLVPEDGDFYSVERDGVSMTIARRGVRPEDIVIPEAKPKARRKKSVKVPDQPVSVMNRGGSDSPTQEPSLPVRCHCKRGMIIGAGPRKGQCTVCGNPKPLSSLFPKEPT